MILLLPAGKLEDGLIAVNIGNQQYSLAVGDPKVAAEFDRWVEANEDRTSWAAWAQRTQGDGKTIEGLNVLTDVLRPTSELDQWAAKIEREYSSFPESAWKERAALIVRVKEMDSDLHRRLIEDCRTRLKGCIAKIAEDFPSVPEQLAGLVPPEVLDSEIAKLVASAKSRRSEREAFITSRLEKAWEDAHSTDAKADKFESYTGRWGDSSERLLLGTHYLRQIDNKGESESHWIGNFEDAKYGRQEKVLVGTFLNGKNVMTYPITLNWPGPRQNTLSFKFKSESERGLFLKKVVAARIELQKEASNGFVTDVTAPVNFFSEAIDISGMRWSIHCNEALPKGAIVFKGQEGPEYVIGDNPGGNWNTIRFKSTIQHPIRLRLERNPFQMTESLIAALGSDAVDPEGPLQSVMEKARNKGALTTAMALVTAIENFYGDYSRFPAPNSGSGNDKDAETDTSVSEGIVTALLGKNPAQNSKNRDYIGDIKPAKIQDGRNVDGLITEQNKLSIVDAWGSPFKIRMDSNYDNELDNPNTEDRENGHSKFRKRVLIWSAGKDRDPSTWEDNITSWGNN